MSPVCLRAQHRHTLAGEAEAAPGLGAGRHLDPRLAAVDRRHLEFAAQRRRHHRDRNTAMQVGAVALEERVRGERQENIEVAGRPAAHAGLAFAGEANAGAVLDAGRDVDRQRALARDPSRARAGRARVFDHLAAALADRTGALEREEALGVADAAVAAADADRSSAWCRPWRRCPSRPRRSPRSGCAPARSCRRRLPRA